MANARDNSTLYQPGTTALTFSFSHTITTSNVLFVLINDNDAHGQNHQLPSSVTYNSIAMTNASAANLSLAQLGFSSIWYLINPSTGTNTVSVTIPSTGNGDGTSGIIAVAASYTGASTTGIPDAAGTNSAGSGTSLTVNLTTVADNSWVIALISSNQAPPSSASTGMSELQHATVGYGLIVGDSNANIHPAGATSIAATNGASGFWLGVAISFAPAAATASTPVSNLTLLGVG